jgi:hypothetical protein
LGRENINKSQEATKEIFDELEKERDSKKAAKEDKKDAKKASE